MHLVRAELLKVRSTRLWVGLLLGALGYTALVTILLLSVLHSAEGRAAGLQPIVVAEDLRRFLFISQGATPFVLVLAATIATSEYRYGTAPLTYLATPSRALVLAGKAAAAAIIGLAFGLAVAASALGITVVWLAVDGAGVPFDAGVIGAIAQIGLHGAYVAVIALAVGALVRSQIVSILGLLGWLFIVEPLATSLVPRITEWTPFAGTQQLFGTGDTARAAVFGTIGALLLALAYLAVFWFGALLAERSRDV